MFSPVENALALRLLRWKKTARNARLQERVRRWRIVLAKLPQRDPLPTVAKTGVMHYSSVPHVMP